MYSTPLGAKIKNSNVIEPNFESRIVLPVLFFEITGSKLPALSLTITCAWRRSPLESTPPRLINHVFLGKRSRTYFSNPVSESTYSIYSSFVPSNG